MEAMGCLIMRKVDGGLLFGCRIGDRDGEVLVISHLVHANDILLFCKESQYQVVQLSLLLMWFQAISGLRISLNKREIYPVGNATHVESLALELGWKVGALRSSYLSLPLGVHHNLVAVWNGIEERFHKRLTI